MKNRRRYVEEIGNKPGSLPWILYAKTVLQVKTRTIPKFTVTPDLYALLSSTCGSVHTFFIVAAGTIEAIEYLSLIRHFVQQPTGPAVSEHGACDRNGVDLSHPPSKTSLGLP